MVTNNQVREYLADVREADNQGGEMERLALAKIE